MKEKVVVNAEINSDSFLRMEIREASPPFFHPVLSLNAMTLNSCQMQSEYSPCEFCAQGTEKRLSQGKRLTQYAFHHTTIPQACRKPAGSQPSVFPKKSNTIALSEHHLHGPWTRSLLYLDSAWQQSYTNSAGPVLTGPFPTLLF